MEKETYCAVGRRKRAVARVFLTPGKGKLEVNGKNLDDYLKRNNLVRMVKQPLVATETEGKYNIKANVKGGGTSGQAGALRLGIARAIILHDESMRGALKENGFLTRDARAKERKKYGQPGARKKFQFSKR
ncbi:MAG: 30S ribosomal protein S9 [Candidatus Krumholzibacteriales bacterium]